MLARVVCQVDLENSHGLAVATGAGLEGCLGLERPALPVVRGG